MRSRRRLTIFERHAHGRAVNLLGNIGLRSGNPWCEHRQPSRSIDMTHRTGCRKAFPIQQIVNAALQFLLRARNHPRGNLFGSDFE